MTKKRVLWVGEFSGANSGFSTYGREVLSRLHATGHYDVAELAAYGSDGDDRVASIPWKVYGNMPRDDREREVYNSSVTNQWGEWKFEDVLLDWRPECVLDCRDFWCFEFILRSPFRDRFRLGLMPAWDSSPVQDQWVDAIRSADGLLSYSEWAVGEMWSQMGPGPPILGTASPGVDHDVFKPASKAQCRSLFGVPPDALVAMFVCRNQARKLIPDLFESFALLRSIAPPEMRGRLKLYLHTAYPDVGWDVPRFLREFGLGDAVLFTYSCRECGAAFAHTWLDSRAVCPHCRGPRAMTVSPDRGVSSDVLAKIYNIADVYVQYSICGGFEIPIVEASACGVKCLVVDYSAMEDFPETVRAEPVKVERFFWDAPTHTRRALPDNRDCAEKLLRWLSLPETVRAAEGGRVAAAAGRYTWERAAGRWAELIEGFAPPAAGWSGPPRVHQPRQLPAGLSSFEFVSRGLAEVAGWPELVGGYFNLRMARDLERGVRVPHTGLYNFTEASGMDVHLTFTPYTREDCHRDLLNLCRIKNFWETRRWEATQARPGT